MVCHLRKELEHCNRQYRHVAIGGTFDLFHPGHRALLEKAIEIGKRVTIGLTTNELVSRMYKNHEIEDYDTRLSRLEGHLVDRHLSDRVEIIPLGDSFGPTIHENDFDAIVVSRETERGAEEINEIRRSKKMGELAVVVIDMVLAEDEMPISSTRIRQGIIDLHGKLRTGGSIFD